MPSAPTQAAFVQIMNKPACWVRIIIYVLHRQGPVGAGPVNDLIVSCRCGTHFIQIAQNPRLSILLHTPQGDKFFM